MRVRIDPPVIDVSLARREEHELRLTGADNLDIVNKLPEDLQLIYDPNLVTFDPNPVVVVGPAPEIQRIKADPSVFKFAHLTVWQSLMVFLTGMLWLVWATEFTGRPKHDAS